MGVIIQYDGIIPPDDLERIAEGIRNDMKRDGFVVLDKSFTIIKINDEEEQ